MVLQCEIAVWGMAGTPDLPVPPGLVGNGWVRAFFWCFIERSPRLSCLSPDYKSGSSVGRRTVQSVVYVRWGRKGLQSHHFSSPISPTDTQKTSPPPKATGATKQCVCQRRIHTYAGVNLLILCTRMITSDIVYYYYSNAQRSSQDLWVCTD